MGKRGGLGRGRGGGRVMGSTGAVSMIMSSLRLFRFVRRRMSTSRHMLSWRLEYETIAFAFAFAFALERFNMISRHVPYVGK